MTYIDWIPSGTSKMICIVLLMIMINLGEHVVRSVVVAVVDVVGGVHLAALAALVTGRLQ